MKKILSIAFLLFCQTFFCQDYVFDKFIEYEEVGRANIIFMFNSADTTYFFFSKNYGDNLEGTITDEKSKMTHRYEIVNNKKGINYNYMYSEPIKSKHTNCPYKENIYETTHTETDSIASFEIKRFKNKNKRVVLATEKVDALQSNFNSFPTIMNFLFNHFICCQDLQLPKNYIPTLATINYQNGKIINTKLVQIQDINTQLSITLTNLKTRENYDKIYKHRK